MSAEQSAEEVTPCSFCQKPERQVRKIITGPGVAICDECVALCLEILAVELGHDWQSRRSSKRR